MASPPLPPSLEQLTNRSFAFYPPIVGVEHNEWEFRKATWSEILVVNSRTGAEVWISRRFVGEVSRVEDPILIVGLARELELKGGMIVPFQRRVLEMPVAVGAPRPVAGDDREEQRPPGIRLEPSDRKIVKLILVAVGSLIGLYVVALGFTRVGDLRQKNVVPVGMDQSFAALNARDDALGVVQKMGQPATDREQEMGTILFRAMGYPQRHYTVILMGRDKGSMGYIGTMSDEWAPIHSANSRDESLLRNLKRF